MEKKFSHIYWAWLPLIFFVIQAALEFLGPINFLDWYLSENGPIEVAQTLIMVAAFLFALFCVFSKKIKPAFLKLWFALAALCCFYVAGEEVSWGQHILDWETPENWSAVNDQNETNLHNTSSWFDQKPRLVLLIGIIFGGLIAPALKKVNLLKLPEKLDCLLPSSMLGVIVILIIIPKILEKIFEAYGVTLFVRFSEIEELYMFYFVLLYLIMLYQKTQNKIFS